MGGRGRWGELQPVGRDNHQHHSLSNWHRTHQVSKSDVQIMEVCVTTQRLPLFNNWCIAVPAGNADVVDHMSPTIVVWDNIYTGGRNSDITVVCKTRIQKIKLFLTGNETTFVALAVTYCIQGW